MERCLGKEEGWMLRKSGFYLKAYTHMCVCMHDKNKMIELREEWDNGNFAFLHRRQMRERGYMFICLLSMFCHEYFERHKM